MKASAASPTTEDHPLEFEEIVTVEERINYLVHLKAYESVADICRGKQTLDWGCNNGFGLEVLARNGAHASGLDVSARAVAAARTRLAGTCIAVEHFDGLRAPFADRSFDVVISFQVIEHVSDPAPYLAEIRRVLRPDGCAVFTTPNAILRIDPGTRPWNPFHVREFSPDELRALLGGSFAHVKLKGLFAADEIYWIERKRVERFKVAARQPPPRVSPLEQLRRRSKSLLKRLLPDAVVRVLRPPPPPPDLARYSLDEIFYRDDRLDDALDLMAICR